MRGVPVTWASSAESGFRRTVSDVLGVAKSVTVTDF